METAAYWASPAASGACSLMVCSMASGWAGAGAICVMGLKPSVLRRGVAVWMRIGGGCSENGCGWLKVRGAVAYCTPSCSDPLSDEPSMSLLGVAGTLPLKYVGWPAGGIQPPDRGDVGPKPGVFGAD